ncbi:MAG: flagellar export protein FliJ [Candidatus Brocadia sapporoensis]|nr:hypothetical protein [Candidatus Brocadia sp.]GJQ23649.1 MAG: flagellar export protein FliJ [Candidatus Brocadia sapporoensis]
MKYCFKFQKSLEIEKHREKNLVKELNILKKQLHNEENLLVFLQSVLTLKQLEMEKALHTQRDAKVFVCFESYFLKLSHDITIQASKVKEVFKRTESVKNSLLNVFKKRKVLEKLHERQEKEYKKQVLTLENKQFDEIATSRFYQKYKNKNIC